jgi:hypothetical protein
MILDSGSAIIEIEYHSNKNKTNRISLSSTSNTPDTLKFRVSAHDYEENRKVDFLNLFGLLWKQESNGLKGSRRPWIDFFHPG